MIAACGALTSVAVLGNMKAIGTFQSTLLIVLLGGGIAARVVANQVASTQAHHAVEEALARQEHELREADKALERVRETNETLRRSEEHLRLVFDDDHRTHEVPSFVGFAGTRSSKTVGEGS